MEYDSKKILSSILNVIENIDNLEIDEELKKFIVGFSMIPRDNQMTVVNGLIDSYNLQEQIRIERENKKKCAIEGHIFGDYRQQTGNRYGWKYKYWARECMRCGILSITYEEPEELVKVRKDNKLQLKLQKKLEKLKKRK